MPASHKEQLAGPAQMPRAGAPGAALAQRIRSQELLGGAREIVIEHNRRDYRLRVTAQGKLILTA